MPTITKTLTQNADLFTAGVVLGSANFLIYALNGNDTVTGDTGNDTIYGDAGNDLLDGKAGADNLFGGEGNDKLIGGIGSDMLYGGLGNDTILGDDESYTAISIGNVKEGKNPNPSQYAANADIIYAGEGNDIAAGGSGNDIVYGGAGNDKIYGGTGINQLYGEAGQDFLYGSAGDLLSGGAEYDVFTFGKSLSVNDGVVYNGGFDGAVITDWEHYTLDHPVSASRPVTHDRIDIYTASNLWMITHANGNTIISVATGDVGVQSLTILGNHNLLGYDAGDHLTFV